MIFPIFEQKYLDQPDFGRFLAKMGVLSLIEAKKCTKCLVFLPSPMFKSQMEPLCKNWILPTDFFSFLEKYFCTNLILAVFWQKWVF